MSLSMSRMIVSQRREKLAGITKAVTNRDGPMWQSDAIVEAHLCQLPQCTTVRCRLISSNQLGKGESQTLLPYRSV
jgi:hypothetical protein